MVRNLSFANAANTYRNSIPNKRDISSGGSFQNSPKIDRKDHGIQVFEPGVCYYMYPGYWVNQSDMHDEPRELLRSPAGQINTGISSSALDDLTALHLPIDQEDILINWHTKHVEPFMKCSHIQAGKNEISMFRIGRSIIPREIEAGIFSIQALTVAAMPSSLIQALLGQSRQALIKHFKDVTERALARANLMRTRNHYLFSAFLHYIVSPPTLLK